MNIETLDKCCVDIDHSVMSLEKDGSNGSAFFRADVISLNDPAFKNYGGYPRNEIAIINEQQSEVVANALLERLQVLPDDSKVPSKVSDAELRLSLKSRYQQTPSEEIAYYERMVELRQEKEKIAAEEQARRERIAKAEKEREDLLNSLTSEEKEALLKKKREKAIETLID